MFERLTPEAKAHCIEEYYSRVCPYDTEGDRDKATAEGLEQNIIITLECCEELTIDESGNWYFEGVMV